MTDGDRNFGLKQVWNRLKQRRVAWLTPKGNSESPPEPISDSAKASLQQLTDNPEQRYWYDRNLWDRLIEGNGLDAAISILQRAVEDEDRLNVRLNLAKALTEAGKLEAAQDCYRGASRLKFSKSYPNLRLGDRGLRPHFLIIGAPKCGTSSLYSYLASHPQVLPAVVKEVDFWSHHLDYGLSWYLSHFPPVDEEIARERGIVTGEASPSYWTCPQACDRIAEALPEVRLIVALRHPVDRALSQYYDRVARQQETRSLDVAMRASLAGSFANETEAQLGRLYLDEGCYSRWWRHWRSRFPPERLHVVCSETLLADPEATTNEVFRYLDLPERTLDRYQHHNAREYPEADSALRRALWEYFRPEIEALTDDLGHSLQWEAPSP